MHKPNIFPAAVLGGYYINHKFVFACNWFVSKEKFNAEEQKAFEKYMKSTNIVLITSEIREKVISMFINNKENSISILAEANGITLNQTNAIISKYLKSFKK